MKKKVYAVYDSCAAFYSPPMCFMNDGEAKRDFTMAVSQDNSKIAMHPEHFSMHCIGSYDDAKGEIEKLEPSYCVCKAVELLNVVELKDANNA